MCQSVPGAHTLILICGWQITLLMHSLISCVISCFFQSCLTSKLQSSPFPALDPIKPQNNSESHVNVHLNVSIHKVKDLIRQL